MTIEEMIQQTVREVLADELSDLKPQSNAKERLSRTSNMMVTRKKGLKLV